MFSDKETTQHLHLNKRCKCSTLQKLHLNNSENIHKDRDKKKNAR